MRKKMYKDGKHWVVAGAIIAGVVTLNVGTANADVVQKSEPSVSVTVPTSEASKQEQYDAASASVSNSIAALPSPDSVASDVAVEQQVSQKTSVVNSLSGAVDAQQAVVNQQSAAVANAATLVSSQESVVAEASSVVASDKNTTDSLSATADSLASAIENQPSAIASASSAVASASDYVESTQDKLTDAGHDVTSASNKVATNETAVSQAESNHASAVAKASEATKSASSAAEDLNDAKLLSQNAESVLNKDSAQVSLAQSAYTSESTKLASTPTSVKGLAIATPAPNAESFPEDSWIRSDIQLPVVLAKPQNVSQTENSQYSGHWYAYDSEFDTSAPINGSLTVAQQKELANYALTLINDFRSKHGLPAIHMTNETENAAFVEMNERVQQGYDNAHYTSDTYFTDNGFGTVQLGQNLGIQSHAPSTMLSAKVQILNQLTSMAYQDGFWAWGHRDNMLLDANNYASTGTSVELYFGFYYVNQNYLFDTYLLDSTQVAKLTSNIDVPVVNNNTGYVPNPAYAAQQAKVASAASALTDAQAKYTADSSVANNATQTVNDAQVALTSANQALSSANYVVSVTQDAIKTAQTDLATSKTQLKLAQAVFSNLSNELTNAQDALVIAQDNLATVSDSALLHSRLAAAQTALSAAKTQLASDEATLAKQQGILGDNQDNLATQQDNLAEALAALTSVKAQLVAAQSALDDANSEVDSAKQGAQDNIDAAKKNGQAYLDALHKQLFDDDSVSSSAENETTSTPAVSQDQPAVLNLSQNSGSEKEVVASAISTVSVPAQNKSVVDLNGSIELPETAADASTFMESIALLLIGMISGLGLVKTRKN